MFIYVYKHIQMGRAAKYIAAVVIVLIIVFIITNLNNNPHTEKLMVDKNLKLPDVRGLVLSSAGIRGYSLLGSVEELIISGLDLSQITHFAGTSAGSLLSAMFACRIPFQDIKEFIMNFDASIVAKNKPTVNSVLRDKGLYDGDILENIIEQFIAKKTGVSQITLSQVYKKFNSHVIISTTTVKSPMQPYYLSRHNHPNLPLSKAARFSSSIPLVFTLSELDGKYIIDGGITGDPYPIKEIQKSGLSLSQIIGVYIDHDVRNNRNEWKKIMHAIGVTTHAIRRRMPYNALSTPEKQRTVHIITLNKKEHSAINFNISDSDKQELYDIGSETTKKFLHGGEFYS